VRDEPRKKKKVKDAEEDEERTPKVRSKMEIEEKSNQRIE